MKIHGLQKMTLLDFPGKVACTVFLGGCDFRCPFCHNAEILDMNAPALMDENELLKFLEGRKGLLDGVVITGGEPLLRTDIADLLEEIKKLGYPVKLDTNGNHPEVLEKLLEERLVDYVAMDIKNSPEKYAKTIGFESFDLTRVKNSVQILLKTDADYEFRTTSIKGFHDEDSFKAIGEWIEGAKRYYVQNFTDRDSVPYGGLSGFEAPELEKFAKIVRPYVKLCEVRGE